MQGEDIAKYFGRKISPPHCVYHISIMLRTIMFKCDLITLPLPFANNEIGVSLQIIMMDYALIYFYQEAISKNSALQAE